eukprot:TRINITY_DN7773_c1_g1_i1.p1 TRINITY_DN7773_c1_g1~~TRINITY_DN7773_c1_g1_i1.p1  ORF type:complete len:924 (+),score=263.83 TRINITY_DN7773_c1_g1_i1:334-2772(+)
MMDFITRLALLVVTSTAWYMFRKRMSTVSVVTPEQKWVGPLLFVLAVYLNPIALVAAMGSFQDAFSKNVFEFIEFHAATYFTITVQVMYICIISTLKTSSLPCLEKVLWSLWGLLMISADITVAILDTGPSTDYTATYIGWVLRNRVSHLDVGYIILYVAGLLLTLCWLIAAITKTKRLRSYLRRAPYGPTRRAQLVSRSLSFIVTSYVISRTVCLCLYWLLLGRYQPAYRSADESGSIILCAVLSFSLVYQFSPASIREPENCPPLPNDPSWEHPRWRRCKWKESWYQWLREHGGALYYFIHDEEQEEFAQLQKAKPTTLILLSAPQGWPVHAHPDRESAVVNHLHSGMEVEVLEIEDGWCQLLEGTYINRKEDIEGQWQEPARLGFSIQTYSPTAAPVSSSNLFFCVETAARLADLCYSVYYPPGMDDFDNALLIANSFWWSLTVEYCCIGIVTLAASIAMVETGLVQQPEPARSPGNSPANTPTFPPRELAEKGPTANLRRQGLRLTDVIELAGTRVFIATPIGGARELYVCFRGSDNRFTKLNLVSDLRFVRKVWRTMEEAAKGSGMCAKPLLHRGFMDMWEKSRGGHGISGPLQNIPLRDAVLHGIDAALRSFGAGPEVKVYVAGHSLGAALACILAYTLKKRRGIESIVYTYGLPKIGNSAFKKSYESAVPNTFRVVYEYDPVVHVSGTFRNFHVGREVNIDRRGNLLVEPTWVEKTFKPTKTMGVRDMGGHGLGSYTKSLNRVFLRAGSDKRCIYPEGEEGEGSEKHVSVRTEENAAVHVEDDLCEMTDVTEPSHDTAILISRDP